MVQEKRPSPRSDRRLPRGTFTALPRYTDVRSLAILLTVLAVACGSRALAPGTLAPIALTATSENVGVKLRLDVDRASLTPGKELRATITIENTNNEPIRWVGGGCNVPGRATATVSVLADNGRNWDYPFAELKKRLVTVYAQGYVPMLDEAAWQKRASGGQICTADVRVNELAPHGKLISRFVWDGLIAGAPAPSGDVVIAASLDMDDAKAMVGRSVGTSVTLPLTGGAATKVSAPSAFDAALSDARFASWIRARFIASGNSEPAAYNVAGGVRLDSHEWVITASQKLAPAGDIEVRVSAIDGAVRSVIAK